MLLLALLLSARADDLPDLRRYVRVDVPDWPGALASSARGSLLAGPPTDGTPWRYESTAEIDQFVATEAVEALQVEGWHEAGFDGSGVKVAVFDPQLMNAELEPDELGEFETHDCFAHEECTPVYDTLRPEYASESGSHGVACAETIRDLAPGVELHLVRVSTLTTLENAAAWAAREGIDVVSMSLSFYNDSFFDGTGPVSDVIPVMQYGDVLMVKSAGNSATEHWMESFDDPDQDGYHEFPWDSDYLPVWLPVGSTSIYLNWDQYTLCGDTDLDLYVYRSDGALVARSEDRQDMTADRCQPVESLSADAEEEGWFYVQVRRAAGNPVVRFAIIARGADVWNAMAAGSITDPGNHPAAFTVAAVRASHYLENGPESFSSQGPTQGGLAKPDIAGPDGLTSSVYGPVGFYGTSASTPAVAAAVALVLSRYPDKTPYEAAETLRSWALSERSTWESPDMALGAGYARLPPLESDRQGCGDRPLILPLLYGTPFLFLRRRRTGKRRR